jgi:phosphoesterase RecJ-like protein
MSVPVPAGLLDFIKNGSKFIVAGHKEPDGDCAGSQLALASVLQRLGKTAIACSEGSFKRSEVYGYRERFVSVVSKGDRENARVIVVDCSAANRTGAMAPYLEGLPTAIIDHHATNDLPDSSAGDTVFLDPNAPSVTFMIFALIEALNLEPTPEEAKFLFLGLCTDTGFFRHIDSTGAETFERASRMIRAGANPKETFRAINGGKSLASRQLLGILLVRSQAYFGGKLILTTEEYHETQHFGLESRDPDALYQLLQMVSGVEAIVVIRQETMTNCTVGFRSLDAIDVGAVAALFGGGGHKNAAGLMSINGTIDTIRPQILAAFEALMEEPR